MLPDCVLHRNQANGSSRFSSGHILKPGFQCAVTAGDYRRQVCLRQFRYIGNTLPAMVAGSKGTLETHCLRLSAAAGGTGKKLTHVQLFKVPQAVTGTLETLPAAAGGSLLSIFCHAIQMNQ